MPLLPGRLSVTLKALRQLGFSSLFLYGRYQAGLKSGYYRWKTRRGVTRRKGPALALDSSWFYFPEQALLSRVLGERASELVCEANEITAWKVRLFGGEPVQLELAAPGKLQHWTFYEKGTGDRGEGSKVAEGTETSFRQKDIKFIWEPGRFGWAITLARAYYLTGDERYAHSFWIYTDTFLEANPPYQGPHWASAQEVALRLISLAFALPIFAASPETTAERQARLAQFVAKSAERIPLTLVYARSQNNNHLISEAAGLYTASLLLPQAKAASKWQKLGWSWFHQAVQGQVSADGVYIQQSANYHRLMLQAALWIRSLCASRQQTFPAETLERLGLATRWLLALVDPETGRVPNLGPNDGANILPLAACPFEDYRPVLQAAGQAFLGERPFKPGPWDEMAVWLCLGEKGKGEGVGDEVAAPAPDHEDDVQEVGVDKVDNISSNQYGLSPHVIHCPVNDSRAYFRVARFDSRPGHADQLHVDLWWRGLNVAQDAGTYVYNGMSPWNNSLSGTAVHNTIMVDGKEQMTQAGKFLWLDWTQGRILEIETGADGELTGLSAVQDGYQQLGVLHRRKVAVTPAGQWKIEDVLLRAGPSRKGEKPRPYHIRLHWLLPDWPWQLVSQEESSRLSLLLASPEGLVELQVQMYRSTAGNSADDEAENSKIPAVAQLYRAGEVLYGPGPAEPYWGWASPTYGVKTPALSFSVEMDGFLPLGFDSLWVFPPE